MIWKSKFRKSVSGAALAFGLIIALPLCATMTSAQERKASDYPTKARVAPIEIVDMNARQKEVVGIVKGQPIPKRANSTLFKTLMHHPELVDVYFPLGDRVSKAPEFPDKQRELIIMRTAWLYQGQYEWSQHYGNALKAGWTADEIERIKIGASAPQWEAGDRILLMATDQLVRNAFLEDDIWAALREDYSVQDIMTMITMITHYHWVAMMTKSLGVQPNKDVIAFDSKPAQVEFPGLKKETSVAFVEGPAWRPDGVLFFTDIPNNRIMRWAGKGPAKVHRTPAGHANGLAFDAQNRLVIAETDGRLVRENKDGSLDVLAEKYDGNPFNSLNDLTIDTKGRIYFTDTAYRNRKNATQRDVDGTVVDAVYRVDEKGKLTRVLAHEIDMPNGILVSPRDEYLYVADNSNRPGGVRQLVRFDLDKKGNVKSKSKKLLFDWGTDRGPDGMALDVEGNIYVAAGLNFPLPNRTSLVYKGGIYVFSPEGKLIDFLPVPMDSVSNVTFGGADMKTLYITAGHSVWSYPSEIAGYMPFSPVD